MKIQLAILLGLALTCCAPKETKKLPPKPEGLKYNRLSVEQQLKGNADSALFFIDHAIQADSSFYWYYVQRLSLLWALNRNDEALVAAKKISKLRNYENVSMEGIAYERLGNMEKARALYKETVDHWRAKDLEAYSSRLEYALLVTILYGTEKGLEELNKIDESKIPPGQDKAIEYIRKSIKSYKGIGYMDFEFLNGALTKYNEPPILTPLKK
jgi:tetratricopeptide (TPR) repeat protein